MVKFHADLENVIRFEHKLLGVPTADLWAKINTARARGGLCAIVRNSSVLWLVYGTPGTPGGSQQR